MASTPSADEDNHKNKLQDSTSKALDTVMSNTEQSYDDFVDSFTYLKKNDVLAQKVPHESSLQAYSFKGATVDMQKIGTSKVSEKTLASGNAGTTHSSHQEELETEVLGDGDTSSRLSHSKMLRTGTAVKVDNFVESEDLNDDLDDMEDIHTEGYFASFTPGQPLQPRRGQPASQSHDSAEANDMAELFNGQISLDENSTDKLLMNFLADLQNESNEQSPVNIPSKEDSSQDIQNFLNKKKEEKEEVTFSDEDSDSASNLLDNSKKGNVKVVVKPEELVAIESKVKNKPVSNSDEITIDSEGNRVAHVSNPSNTTMNELQESNGDILFPGEAENTDSNPGTSHESLLDFKAVKREASIECAEQTSQAECSNTVEPFQLDQDFDYDNVVLTPKYSLEDMRKLQTLVTQVS